MTKRSVSTLKQGSLGLLGIQKSLFLLGLLCFFILVATFFKVDSFKSLIVSDNSLRCETLLTQTQIKQTLEIVIQKTKSRIKEIKARANSSESESESSLKQHSFLEDILGLLKSVNDSLPTDDLQAKEEQKSSLSHNPQDHFLVEELRKYVKAKPNRLGRKNFMGANDTFTSIGHTCFSMKRDLESYMSYDVGDFCEDDWPVGQRLMVHGCDPLPRRRCFARAPRLYAKPLPSHVAAWTLPDDRNVRWSHYKCKSFSCLAKNRTKGFYKCVDCFDLENHEFSRWVQEAGNASDFLAHEVVGIKPGEIRIGLDFSVGTGTFAARMRELNVTVVTATINLGAPFSEMIALRGLVPLYLTVNQRLPFFDNTLDLIHTTRFLDGWIDFVLLDLVLYDWDRVLRPGGLLWIDDFFCLKEDLDDYLESFKMLRYKRHKWVVVPKLDRDDREVFFSAVLEKPPRPFP